MAFFFYLHKCTWEHASIFLSKMVTNRWCSLFPNSIQGSSHLFLKQFLLPASSSWQIFLKVCSWYICNSQQINLIFSYSFFAAMTFSCSCMLVFGFPPCFCWLQPTVKQELLGMWFLHPELWLRSQIAYLCLCLKLFNLDCIFPFFLEMGLNIAPKQINHFHPNSSLIQLL